MYKRFFPWQLGSVGLAAGDGVGPRQLNFDGAATGATIVQPTAGGFAPLAATRSKITGWFYPADADNGRLQHILSQNLGLGLLLAINGDTDLTISVQGGAAGVVGSVATGGSYYFEIELGNGTSTPYTIKLNGDTQTLTSGARTDTQSMLIGANNSGANGFTGTIRDVNVYSWGGADWVASPIHSLEIGEGEGTDIADTGTSAGTYEVTLGGGSWSSLSKSQSIQTTRPAFVVAGDSNAQGVSVVDDTPPQAWSKYTWPVARENVGFGGEAMSGTTAKVAALASFGTDFICLTVGTNDVKNHVNGGFTAAQGLALMQSDFLDLSLECIENGMFPVVNLQHYLTRSIYSWSEVQGIISEEIIDLWNAWLISKASATTWAIADIRGVNNPSLTTPGTKGMLPAYLASGPDWNESAIIAVIGPAYQATLETVSAFTPQTLTMSSSRIEIPAYILNKTSLSGKITGTFKQNSTTGTQRIAGNPSFANGYLAFQLTGTGAQYMRNNFDASGLLTLTQNTTETTFEVDWPAALATTTGRLQIPGFGSYDSGTVIQANTGETPSTEPFVLGSGTSASNLPFIGYIKNIRVFEGGYLVHDWRINEGDSTIKDLVGAANGTLTGAGTWA